MSYNLVGNGARLDAVLGPHLDHTLAVGGAALALKLVAPIADVIGFLVVPIYFLASRNIPDSDKYDTVLNFGAGIAGMVDEAKGVASVFIIMKHEKTGINVHGVVNVEFFRGNGAGEMVDLFFGDNDSAENSDDFTFFNIADGINALPFHAALSNFQRFADPRLYFHRFLFNHPFNSLSPSKRALDGGDSSANLPPVHRFFGLF